MQVRIPKGWRRRCLQDVAHLQTGISKSSNRVLKDPLSLPYLRVANVQDGHLALDEIKVIELERENAERYLLQNGDVLLTEGGDYDKLGRGFVWHGQIEPCAHQNHVFAVRPEMGKLLPHFFAAQAGSPYGKRYFLSCAKQTTNLASINSTQLKQFPVLLPPIEEQRAIVRILSTWDGATEQLERLIAVKERRRRTLLQQLLNGRRRFPEFVKSEASRDTRFGRAPVDWPIRLFEEFLSESRTTGSHGEVARKITVKLYGKGVRPKDERRLGSSSTQYYLRRDGQFIYSKLDFLNGAFGIVPIEMDGFESTLDLPAFDIDQGLDPDFLIAFVTRPIFYTRCIGYAMGGRKARRVPPEQFLSIKFPCPSIEEQQRIVATLRSCDVELDQLRAQLAALKQQKKGLMQKLLTGDLRVETGQKGRQ